MAGIDNETILLLGKRLCKDFNNVNNHEDAVFSLTELKSSNYMFIPSKLCAIIILDIYEANKVGSDFF